MFCGKEKLSSLIEKYTWIGTVSFMVKALLWLVVIALTTVIALKVIMDVFFIISLASRPINEDVKWADSIDVYLKILGGIGILYMYYTYQRENHALQNETLKLQREATVHRSLLSLNVQLQTEVTPHNEGVFIRPTVIVHNVSSNLFCVPAVYISGRLIPSVTLTEGSQWDNLIGNEALRTKNAAKYGSSMASLAPGETEQFSTWFYISPELIKDYPSALIRVDVLGAHEADGALAKIEYRDRFMAWMEKHDAHHYPVFRSWEVNEREDLAKENDIDVNGLPRKRCLLKKPDNLDMTPTKVDIKSTVDWVGFLDKGTMMWDRYAIVSLKEGQVKSD